MAARGVEAVGGVFKRLGVLLGIAALAGAILTASELGGAVMVFGIVGAAAAGLAPFIGGILISAQGQVLKATLDTAVNTSPFLENEERLALLSEGVRRRAETPPAGANEPTVAACVVCGMPLAEAERHLLKGASYCDQHFSEAIG